MQTTNDTSPTTVLVAVFAVCLVACTDDGGAHADGGETVGDGDGDGDGDGGDGDGDGEPIAPGSIVITEFLTHAFNNADDVTLQQWVELHNPTDAAIDLVGCSAGASLTLANTKPVTDSLVVPAGGYILIGRSTDPALNNNVPVLWSWSPYPGLGTQGGYFTLFGPDDEIIDQVVYSYPEWPYNGSGYSFSLDPGSIDHLLNDDGANWCAASTHAERELMWSPAAANPACPAG